MQSQGACEHNVDRNRPGVDRHYRRFGRNVEAAGREIPRRSEDNAGKIADFEDPDGNLLYMTQLRQRLGAYWASKRSPEKLGVMPPSWRGSAFDSGLR